MRSKKEDASHQVAKSSSEESAQSESVQSESVQSESVQSGELDIIYSRPTTSSSSLLAVWTLDSKV